MYPLSWVANLCWESKRIPKNICKWFWQLFLTVMTLSSEHSRWNPLYVQSKSLFCCVCTAMEPYQLIMYRFAGQTWAIWELQMQYENQKSKRIETTITCYGVEFVWDWYWRAFMGRSLYACSEVFEGWILLNGFRCSIHWYISFIWSFGDVLRYCASKFGKVGLYWRKYSFLQNIRMYTYLLYVYSAHGKQSISRDSLGAYIRLRPLYTHRKSQAAIRHAPMVDSLKLIGPAINPLGWYHRADTEWVCPEGVAEGFGECSI